MQVSKVMGTDVPVENAKVSEEELQDEYNYLLAEQMTKQLQNAGLITAEEYDEIMSRNVLSFRPLFSRIGTY